MPDPDKSVFINCPYDAEYETLFDALVFTIVCCGLSPRCATESGTVSEARMERIFEAIFGSNYSIHDLSRCRGEGEQMLARFNMPLELGIALTRRRAADRNAAPHDWLVLVPENAPYERFLSDLKAFDLTKYDGTADTLVRRVMAWLFTRPGVVPGVKPSDVIKALPEFRNAKIALKSEWSDMIPWPMLVEAAVKHAPHA